MYSQKSPGGSIFPYPYKGGEIHCLKFGSYKQDYEALFAMMKAEEEFVRNMNRQLRIWVDFYETELNDKAWSEFLQSIDRMKGHITKLAMVGCAFGERWRYRRQLKNSKLELRFPVRFFDDPEDAKTWLVME